MSAQTAKYPTSVWDRSSPTRSSDPGLDREPVWEDWDQAVAEMIAMETDLLHGLDGFNVDNVADANVIGGIPVVHKITIGNSAGSTDVVLTHKTRVLDVLVVKTTGNGASGDTLTIKNGTTNVITDAISLNKNDTLTTRAGSIDDAYHEIAAGGTLRATVAKNTNCACVAYVLGVRVA